MQQATTKRSITASSTTSRRNLAATNPRFTQALWLHIAGGEPFGGVPVCVSRTGVLSKLPFYSRHDGYRGFISRAQPMRP